MLAGSIGANASVDEDNCSQRQMTIDARQAGPTRGLEQHTDLAVTFLMMVVGTVLAPDHTGLLNRSTTFRISVRDILVEHIQSRSGRHGRRARRNATSAADRGFGVREV
jgi:hypothetical protein